MENNERQQELRKRIAAFEARRAKFVDEIRTLTTRRDEHTATLAKLKQSHAAACRAEALDQANDHQKIEREISSATARLSGTVQLIGEKERERQRLNDENAPFERELQQLIAIETRDRSLAEIQTELDQGKRDLKEFFRIQARHEARIALLMSRREREADSFVASSAARVAELLRNAGAGIRVGDLFTQEDFKELAAFGKRFG